MIGLAAGRLGLVHQKVEPDRQTPSGA